MVIFSILVVIQFVVITKGSTRVSEVAARFTLDGMPDVKMAIDADLNSGLINQQQAQQQRLELTQQADFYGAMDGASKFVRGDAVAATIITLINIVVGLGYGVFKSGMGFTNAAEVYTKLTIGDGLSVKFPLCSFRWQRRCSLLAPAKHKTLQSTRTATFQQASRSCL